jgi:SAM-dependent methyltransferase
MSHKEQLDFVAAVKEKHPEFFTGKRVLEVGSLNINGTVRDFFTDCDYTGCDLGKGKGVDIVCAGQHLNFPDNSFDVVLSCECFEHNPAYQETLRNMVRMLKPGGLLFFTCATTGRPEHGTTRTSPKDAPFCGDYYRNLVAEDLDTTGIAGEFSTFNTDLRYCGIKHGQPIRNSI